MARSRRQRHSYLRLTVSILSARPVGEGTAGSHPAARAVGSMTGCQDRLARPWRAPARRRGWGGTSLRHPCGIAPARHVLAAVAAIARRRALAVGRVPPEHNLEPGARSPDPVPRPPVQLALADVATATSAVSAVGLRAGRRTAPSGVTMAARVLGYAARYGDDLGDKPKKPNLVAYFLI